ncbi:MAG: hypothetical protein IJW99_11660 [Clostridia bacterium]|nr:hypothetical protein [Clostridia bacterium]
MLLSSLFLRCLSVPYRRTANGGDYAAERAGDSLTLYFEDSDGALDWFHNLAFPAKAYRTASSPTVYAHGGFLRVWRSVLPHLEAMLADPTLTGVTAVGYSHGGALALLCHEYVWFHRPDLRHTLNGYGFGCPRVLFRPDPRLRARFTRFTVIRNRNDAVTYLPPSLWGYAHVGKLLEIGEEGKYSPIDAHRPQNILRELQAWEKENYPNVPRT